MKIRTSPTQVGDLPPSRVAVLYHKDADGFGAAYAAWVHLKDTCELLFLPVQYSEAPPLEELRAFSPNEILIVDFSYPAETLRSLSDEFGEWVTVIDHHATALAELEAWGGKYVFDTSRSGCVLTWQSLNRVTPDSGPDVNDGDSGLRVPEILLYVQDRDLWRWELEHSKEINAFIATMEWSFEEWDTFYTPGAYDAGKAVLAFQKRQVESRVRGANFVLFGYDTISNTPQFTSLLWAGAPSPYDCMMFQAGRQDLTGQQIVPIVNASDNISEVGEALCHAYPDAPFSISYCDRPDGKRSYSLRSRNGFDVSVVAKAFGGGGHPGAAGFTLDAPSIF